MAKIRACMKKWNTFWQDTDGASIAFAMLAFVVASMVSITVITAATTAAKRVHSDRENTQVRLTLNSAAELLREMMKSVTYTETTTVTTPVNSSSSVNVTTTCEGVLQDEIYAAVSYVNQYNVPFESNTGTDFVLKGDGLSLSNVNVSFVMQADDEDLYNIVFTLRMENREETILLSMIGEKKSGTASTTTKADGTVVEEASTYVVWSTGTVSELTRVTE